jgi:hypothetical protein
VVSAIRVATQHRPCGPPRITFARAAAITSTSWWSSGNGESRRSRDSMRPTSGGCRTASRGRAGLRDRRHARAGGRTVTSSSCHAGECGRRRHDRRVRAGRVSCPNRSAPMHAPGDIDAPALPMLAALSWMPLPRSVSRAATAPTIVSCRPSRIQTVPRPRTTRQWKRDHGRADQAAPGCSCG